MGAWRTRFDPAAALGVPAHVTSLWPFVPPPAIDAASLAPVNPLLAFMEALSEIFYHIEEAQAQASGQPFHLFV